MPRRVRHDPNDQVPPRGHSPQDNSYSSRSGGSQQPYPEQQSFDPWHRQPAPPPAYNPQPRYYPPPGYDARTASGGRRPHGAADPFDAGLDTGVATAPPYGADAYGQRDGYGRQPWPHGQNGYGQNGYEQSGYQRNGYGQGTYAAGTRGPGPGTLRPGTLRSGTFHPDTFGAEPFRPDTFGAEPFGTAPFGNEPFGNGPFGNRPRGTEQKPSRRKGRLRRMWRLRTVKVATGLVAAAAVWTSFSIGQALVASNGQPASAKLAEWARDHYLGALVTFGEWITYEPPKVGGKPSFSLTQGVTAGKPAFRKQRGFVPIVPANLASPAGTPLTGEGVWRLTETVKNEPAMYTTFLRPDSVHTSYVAGLVSMDQRLLTFSLHPGAEDPGPGNWKSDDWIPQGSRDGLMATFNGGFKINESAGGFYLNGVSKGTLTSGAASLVYYKNGTVRVGVWGRDFHMSPQIVGVRQNLKPIVDDGRIPADVSKNVLSSWGVTLGGAYYVWRSGIGITKDGRVIYVYGPALDVQTLAGLLQRAGAVEAMQLDINPEWTTFESYHANGHPTDPTPEVVLPTQQSSAYRYYSVWSRDFTAVYAR